MEILQIYKQTAPHFFGVPWKQVGVFQIFLLKRILFFPGNSKLTPLKCCFIAIGCFKSDLVGDPETETDIFFFVVVVVVVVVVVLFQCMPLPPKEGAPCFDWNFRLVLEGLKFQKQRVIWGSLSLSIYIYKQAIFTLGWSQTSPNFLSLALWIHGSMKHCVISSAETIADFLHIRCIFDFGKNGGGDMMSYFRVFVESLLGLRLNSCKVQW